MITNVKRIHSPFILFCFFLSIGVNTAAVSKYENKYTATYGDKINVFADEQNVADKQPFNMLPFVGICAVAVMIVLAIVLSLGKIRNRS